MQGELVKLGHPIAAATVWQILHDAGIDPAPRRKEPTWKQFMTAQAVGDVAAVQAICDSLTEDEIEALARNWLAVLPNPYSAADQAAGYRYPAARFSLTLVQQRSQCDEDIGAA